MWTKLLTDMFLFVVGWGVVIAAVVTPWFSGVSCVGQCGNVAADCAGTVDCWQSDSCCAAVSETLARCSIDPCDNSGACTSLGGAEYCCNCPSSYIDKDSDVEHTPCYSFPCLNGATCNMINIVTYNCTCPYDFIGFNCETELTPCDSEPCKNGGTCHTIDLEQYYCTCPAQYTGATCEDAVDPCLSEPCQNGRLCTTLGVGKYACYCDQMTESSNWTAIDLLYRLRIVNTEFIPDYDNKSSEAYQTFSAEIKDLLDDMYTHLYCDRYLGVYNITLHEGSVIPDSWIRLLIPPEETDEHIAQEVVSVTSEMVKDNGQRFQIVNIEIRDMMRPDEELTVTTESTVETSTEVPGFVISSTLLSMIALGFVGLLSLVVLAMFIIQVKIMSDNSAAAKCRRQRRSSRGGKKSKAVKNAGGDNAQVHPADEHHPGHKATAAAGGCNGHGGGVNCEAGVHKKKHPVPLFARPDGSVWTGKHTQQGMYFSRLKPLAFVPGGCPPPMDDDNVVGTGRE